MRISSHSSIVFLCLLNTSFAQWGGHNWNRPTRAWGWPQASSAPTTFATVASPGPQGPYQTQGYPLLSQTEVGTPQPTYETAGAVSSQIYQTEGGVPTETAQQSGLTGGGIPSATGSAPPTQSSSTSSTNGTSDNTPAKGVIYTYPGTSSQAVSLAPAWACDWANTPGVSNPPFQFVPQLWGPGHPLSSQDIAASDYVLFYNEPDECQTGAGGSCVGTSDTISQFKTNFVPLTSGKKISTPCVTNTGSGFMQTFLQGVGDGAVDILCFHWYGDDLGSLQSTVSTFKQIQQQYNIPEMWISEMGVNSKPSDISQYTSYLDGAVNRYAYNLAYLGPGGTI